MDRTQYAMGPVDAYKPYDLACKKKPAPACKYRVYEVYYYTLAIDLLTQLTNAALFAYCIFSSYCFYSISRTTNKLFEIKIF